MLDQYPFDVQKIGLIVVATTSSDLLMPGISFQVQKELGIDHCICLDVLAGCSGYINAFDIARKYIVLREVEYALVIGVEHLTKWLDEQDVGTSILLGDGAGCTLLGKTEQNKKYDCSIESRGQEGEILTCKQGETIFMDGKKVYKYGVTKTVENVKKILEKNKLTKDQITYIIPHQSNRRIMEKIAEGLEFPMSKMYSDIEQNGNTFCASIPIALQEMMQQNVLQRGDTIILLGYGGGLNLGSIILEY